MLKLGTLGDLELVLVTGGKAAIKVILYSCCQKILSK